MYSLSETGAYIHVAYIPLNTRVILETSLSRQSLVLPCSTAALVGLLTTQNYAKNTTRNHKTNWSYIGLA